MTVPLVILAPLRAVCPAYWSASNTTHSFAHFLEIASPSLAYAAPHAPKGPPLGNSTRPNYGAAHRLLRARGCYRPWPCSGPVGRASWIASSGCRWCGRCIDSERRQVLSGRDLLRPGRCPVAGRRGRLLLAGSLSDRRWIGQSRWPRFHRSVRPGHSLATKRAWFSSTPWP